VRLHDPDDHPIVAAPLAGWTDSPYRKIMKRCGANHIYVPFVSAHALTIKSKNRNPYLNEIASDLCHVQIFGNDPTRCGLAAKMCQDTGALSIDFNCGCSVKKVHKGGGGSLLLKDLDLLARNLDAIVKAVTIPVSLKTRIGFQKMDYISGLTALRTAVDLGCSWVTLHGRTAKQGFTGVADWDPIRELAYELPIPLIGNGDVALPADASRMIADTGCAGVMIGRALMGDPWIVADTENYLANGEARPHRSRREIVDTMLAHQAELLAYYGTPRGVLEFRKHMVRYLRGFAQVSSLRRALVVTNDAAEVRRILNEFGEGHPPADIE
jgi:tRNA-dihydrouridine synthase B